MSCAEVVIYENGICEKRLVDKISLSLRTLYV